MVDDFDLGIKPGSTQAIVGPTGSGKTTLIRLLLRFHVPNSGSIFLDGKEISKINLKSNLKKTFKKKKKVKKVKNKNKKNRKKIIKKVGRPKILKKELPNKKDIKKNISKSENLKLTKTLDQKPEIVKIKKGLSKNNKINILFISPSKKRIKHKTVDKYT